MARVILGLSLICAAFVVFGVQLSSVTTTVAGTQLAAPGLSVNTPTDGNLRIATSSTSAFLSFDRMVPGDRVTAPITVRNDGTLDLRYAVTSAATNDDGKSLMNQLQLTIRSGVTTCDKAGFKADGVILYGDAPLGSVAGLKVIGNPAIGQQAGDRTLRAGASETLCFSVTLPLNTPNAFATAATSATFNFVAEPMMP
jgi:spore coat-associated protein N